MSIQFLLFCFDPQFPSNLFSNNHICHCQRKKRSSSNCDRFISNFSSGLCRRYLTRRRCRRQENPKGRICVCSLGEGFVSLRRADSRGMNFNTYSLLCLSWASRKKPVVGSNPSSPDENTDVWTTTRRSLFHHSVVQHLSLTFPC